MILTVKNLEHSFGNRRIVFPDFELKSGEEILILGPSGCGKTTLLHLLGGMLPVQKGEVGFGKYQLQGMKSKALRDFRKNNVGLVFQNPKFIRSLTIKENIELVGSLAGIKSNGTNRELLDELNIDHIADLLPEKCSQGEQQRAAIATVLIQKPSIILADEPTSALDDVNANAAVNMLKSVAKKRNAILVIVTHDTRLLNIFDQKMILS